MSPQQTTFAGIMFFYVLLSYVLMPGFFFYFVEKSLKSAGNGFVLGSVLSIVLWVTFGSKMI